MSIQAIDWSKTYGNQGEFKLSITPVRAVTLLISPEKVAKTLNDICQRQRRMTIWSLLENRQRQR